jgi:hypothetical protein
MPVMLPLLFALQLAPGLKVEGAPLHPPPRETPATTIGQAVLAPIYHQPFVCSEHPEGLLHGLGDALGTDCMVVGGLETPRVGYFRFFKEDGSTNEDWFGWKAEVHAPIDGVVTQIIFNPTVNLPGVMGKPPASQMSIRGGDGTVVVLGHIADPRVHAGDAVTTGQVIAEVGNNGQARNPHIHVGAYREQSALQIRWDLRAAGTVKELNP